MIQSITFIKPLENYTLPYDHQSHKVVIDLANINLSSCDSFDIKIIFSEEIVQFRDHDYKWVNCKENKIANEYSPKIIKLQNNQIIQANLTTGIWEIDSDAPTILLWRFNPEFAAPLTDYLGDDNKKNISQAKQKFNFIENPALLLPKNEGIEFSRSKKPFTAVACFTDHCDFDTAENLTIQRSFFKEHGIKITKGFFLNHFSKRQDNASFQNQKDELLNWVNDGHELCYHSLSQSLKSDFESFEDFRQFMPPLNNIQVWIDHGFQPYNFSLLKKNDIEEYDFENILIDKNITTLWNYIDSGTATTGVINQFNKKHFTLSSFLNGNKSLGFLKKIQLMIKNIIFHYYNEEDMILKYKNTASNFKKLFFQKNIKSIFPLIKDFLTLGTSIFSILFFWNSTKNRPYKLAKYSPIVFKHIIANEEVYIFQTLEMLDFEKSLSQKNIINLMNEKGVFIAHTYFSVPLEYHSGKLFSTSVTINENVVKNFKFLASKILNEEIWNPTLTELINYWSGFEKVLLDIDNNGIVFEKINSGLIFRNIS
ncbi:hypothetical protein [Flavobacterium chilense]|uniref:Uncharacterized protein n=1 Tax=Flavobacterium chilense TaxID=946677 RepID=A0A1M7GNV5_9FLAO|nr:hypothetical protein [Flavobacterium chilense]SHM17845.1 hypothetical protein SAMN05444484_104284 [Flavobacterium chilense]